MNQRNAPEAVRFGKFLLVGALSTLIDFGLMNFFSGLLHLPLVLSQALSFILAVLNSYILNRLWIYPETRANSLAGQFSKFAIINAAGLALRTVSIPPVDGWFRQFVISNQVNFLGFSPQTLSRNLALGVVLPITLVLNYVANRFWTFGDVARSRTLVRKV